MSTQTRNGYTACYNNTIYHAVYPSSNYVEVSYFIGRSTYASASSYGGIGMTHAGSYCHHNYGVGGYRLIGCYASPDDSIVEDTWCAGGYYYGF